MKVILNSFYPLCHTQAGREAVKRYGLPPFIDGSIRREPDFEHPNPGISGLCRTNKLLPRLSPSDLVIYITNGGEYKRFMVSILEVLDIKQNHLEAATWYEQHQLPIPNNCLTGHSQAFPLDKSHGKADVSVMVEGQPDVIKWDLGYKARARQYPLFAICQIWMGMLNLHKPPQLSNADMLHIFGRIPGTQTPPVLSIPEWVRFQEWLAGNA